jgi:signal transduction histidine kinase
LEKVPSLAELSNEPNYEDDLDIAKQNEDTNFIEESTFLNLARELSQLALVAKESQEELMNLKAQLHKSKLFLNMVIHDMRNPTTSIKSGLESTLAQLKEIRAFHLDQDKFLKKCETLRRQMSELNDNNPSEMIDDILDEL